MYIYIWLIFVRGQLIPEDDCEILAGGSQVGYLDGPNEEATFTTPADMVWRYDELLVAQYRCVRRVSATYTRTKAGDCSTIGDIDGSSDEARFGALYGIDLDANGNVYVADGISNSVKMLGADDYTTTTMLHFNDAIYGLSIKGNIMLIAGSGNVQNCSILNWSCQSLAGVSTLGYFDGANNESMFYNTFDVVSIWDSVIVLDYGNRCLRQIVNGYTRTFFGVCTQKGGPYGDDELMFQPWKSSVSNYETLLVTDYRTLREFDEYGNDAILGTFDSHLLGVEVVGDDLYLSYSSNILKCKWKSMFDTPTPTLSPSPSPTPTPTTSPSLRPTPITHAPTEVARPTERPTPTPNQIEVYFMGDSYVTEFLAIMVSLLLFCCIFGCIIVYCIHKLVKEVNKVAVAKHLRTL